MGCRFERGCFTLVLGWSLFVGGCGENPEGSLGANDRLGGASGCGPNGCAEGAGAPSSGSGGQPALASGGTGAVDVAASGGAPNLNESGGAGAAEDVQVFGSTVTYTDAPVVEPFGIDFTVSFRGLPEATYHLDPRLDEEAINFGVGDVVGAAQIFTSCGTQIFSVFGCSLGAVDCIDVEVTHWGATLHYVDAGGVAHDFAAIVDAVVSPRESPIMTQVDGLRRSRGSFAAYGEGDIMGINGTFGLLVREVATLC